MLKDEDLCLCCGTLRHAGFRELVESAAVAGFRSISLWPQHYESARQQGLTDQDMRLLLEVKNWLPSIHCKRQRP